MASDERYSNSAVDELKSKFRVLYPKAPDMSAVWSHKRREIFMMEVESYVGTRSDSNVNIPTYIRELLPLKHENILRHLVSSYRQLENTANSIHLEHERQTCEKNQAEFQVETELKSLVMRAIMEVPKFENFSSDFQNNGGKSRRQLLLNDETEVQVILKQSDSDVPSSKIKSEGYSLRDIWKDKWHPINLSLSFDVFKRCVILVLEQRKNPIKEIVNNKGDENSFKRQYLKYMFKNAESSQEFLLAVICCLGTDVRFYPSKVLEYLHSRKLLKNQFTVRLPLNLKGQNPEPFRVVLDDDLITKRNAEYLKKFNANPLAKKSSSSNSKEKPLIQIVKLVDLTEDVEVNNFDDDFRHNDNRIRSKDDSRNPTHQSSRSDRNASRSSNNSKPSRLSDTTSARDGEGKVKPSIRILKLGSTIKPVTETGIVRTVTQQVKKKNDDRPKTAIVRTVTQEVKKNDLNKDSSGKQMAITAQSFRDATQKLWQMFFDPGFILSPSISTQWYKLYVNHAMAHKDQLNNCVDALLLDRNRSCHYDIPRLHPAMVEMVKADLSDLERSRMTGSHSLSTVEGIMYSQTSPLQLVLQDPTMNKSVPGPTAWSPTNIEMPYQAFEAHLDWRLSQLGKALDGLEIEMIKLRYAEYLSVVSSPSTRDHGKQFILGIFTAYGPDLYLYPTRVLQLLKKKLVYRPGTKLHSMIQVPVDGRTYTALVPMKTPAPNTSVAGRSLLGEPPQPSNMAPHPNILHGQGQPPFQPIPPPMHQQLMEPQFDPYFQPTPPPPQHHFSYNEQMQHPLDDFPNNSNGYSQGREAGFGNQYHQDPFMQNPDSVFMNPMPPQPQPVPPPSANMNANLNNSVPLQIQPQQIKSEQLPSVLPLEVWKSACERSLSKYGPKYGISGLSEKDYKVLYDRYLFDTFDNPDDFVRGILTGISLARYPRDDDESINTSGLLNLPPSCAPPPRQVADTPPKSILKPILKAPPPAPTIQHQSSKTSITMSRDDLLRISSLIEKMIPNTTDSQPTTQVQLKSEDNVVDYNHHGSDNRDRDDFQRPAPTISLPSRRNYEEEERGFEYRDSDRRQVIDYDHTAAGRGSQSSRNINSQDFFRRSSDTSQGNRPQRYFNPIKRPSDPQDDLYDNLVHGKRRNVDVPGYNYNR